MQLSYIIKITINFIVKIITIYINCLFIKLFKKASLKQYSIILVKRLLRKKYINF